MFAGGRVPLLEVLPLLVLLAYVVPMFLVFLVRTQLVGVPRTARIDKVPRSPYLPRLFMEFGYWMFALPVGACRAIGATPDHLSYASFLVNAGAAVALGAGRFGLGGALLVIAFALDAWDGMLARALGTASMRGEYLDAVIDRYNDLIALLGLAYYYRNDPLPVFLVAASLVGATLVSYTRAKGEACGVDASIGFMQRHERAVYLGVSTIFSPIVAGWLEPGAAHPLFHLTLAMLVLVAVATNVTALLRARYVLRRIAR